MASKKRGIRSMIASIAAAGAIVALGVVTQTASAVTLQSSSGRPGWVAARTDAITQDTSDIFNAGSQFQAAIGVETLQLYASPAASQTQRVDVTEHVWTHWLTGWIDEGWATRTYYIAPGAWRTVVANAAGGPVVGWFTPNGKYLYIPQLTVTWRTSGGAFLGQKVLNYDAASDQHCLTVGCAESNSGYQFSITFLGR